jgi:hypothetical protein
MRETRRMTLVRSIQMSVIEHKGQECVYQLRQEILQMRVKQLRPFLEVPELSSTSVI